MTMTATADRAAAGTSAGASDDASAAAAAAHQSGAAAAVAVAAATAPPPPFSRPPYAHTSPLPPFTTPSALDAHVARAWDYFRALGAPRLHVAPMVDASELPFRMVCRAHGADAAYTPMLHARLFTEHAGYRAEHFTTCAGDRPLFVQFCANDPAMLVKAASLVQEHCDYVDLNLGCPQRIAKKGYYGAYLMDDLSLVERIVTEAAARLQVPISCKIRLFPGDDPTRTIAYAQMLERAGCSLLAVHGRTRDMRDASRFGADWAAIAAVRAAVRVPVIANGDVQCLADAEALIAATGADGVMSAEPLLYYPALFDAALQRPLTDPEARAAAAAAVAAATAPEEGEDHHHQQQQQQQQQPHNPHHVTPHQPSAAADPAKVAHLERLRLCREYAKQVKLHPTHPRMVKGHVHKLLQGWLAEYVDLRERLNCGGADSGAALLALLDELEARVAASGRAAPLPPAKCDRKALAAMREAAREAARAAAIEEQAREAAALAEVEAAAAAAAAAKAGGGGGDQQQQQAAEEPLAKRPCVVVPVS